MPTVQTGSSVYTNKLRKFAESCNKVAADKLRERQTNTPKRQKEAASAAIDGRHMQATARLMTAIATVIESGRPLDGLPVANWQQLAKMLKTKDDFARITRKRIDHSGSYLLRETDEYSDQTPFGEAVRIWLAKQATAEQIATYLVEAAKKRIREMEDALRFHNIEGFFPTPRELILQMVELAEISISDVVLEPSAGKGDILDVIRELFPTIEMTFCEVNHTLHTLCVAKGHHEHLSDVDQQPYRDFMELPIQSGGEFTRVVMNPPFERRQDAVHTMRAYGHLVPGGRLVAIVSPGPLTGSDKVSQEFQAWLKTVSAEVIDVPAGSFKNAFTPTGVSCKIIVANR